MQASLPSAYAQPADDATTRAARARFEEGVRFFDKGDFENARAAFLQAYVLKKHPAVLLNLALSCQKGSHPLEASKYFQQFLRESSQLTEAKRTEAERGLADVRTKLGRIEVVAHPGAEIFVGTERVGTAPLREPVDVDPGTHVVSAKTPEGVTTEQKVATSAGQKVTVKLGEAAKGAEPPPVAPPPPPAKTDPPPAVDPPKQDPPPATEPPANDAPKKKNLLSPPDNMVPVYISLGVAGVGLIGTIAFAASKGSAQDSVTSVENQIRQKRAEEGLPAAGTCVNPTSRYANACSTLQSNMDSGVLRGLMNAAVAALTGDQAWTIERNAIYRRRRDIAVAALREAGLSVSAPQAAIYVWARLPDGVDDVAWVDGLLETQLVSVTPGQVFGPAGRGYVRLSLCLDEDRLKEAAGRIARYDRHTSSP